MFRTAVRAALSTTYLQVEQAINIEVTSSSIHTALQCGLGDPSHFHLCESYRGRGRDSLLRLWSASKGNISATVSRYMLRLKLQASMNGPSQSTRVRACCRWGVPCRCIRGKTMYMFKQFGVNGKLYVEAILSWWFYDEASKWTAPPGVT